MCPQQRTDLVAAQHAPGAGIRILRGHCSAVRVRIVGQDNVGVHPGGSLQRQVQRARLLRIGKIHGGKVGIRLSLFGHEGDIGKAGSVQHCNGSFAADAVHRSQDNPQVTGRKEGRIGECRRRTFIVRRNRWIQHSPAVRGQGDGFQRADGIDPRGDPGVVGRHDLRSAAAVLNGMAAQIHLVTVVLRGIVAGSHHHAAVAIEGPHGESQQRGGQRGRHQEGFNPGGGEDGRRFLGKDVRVIAGVIADDGAWPGPGRSLTHHIYQESRQAGGDAAHHHAVHPVRPGSQGGAEACGAELQRAAEAVGQLLRRCRGAVLRELQQLGECCGSGGIRIFGRPVAGLAEQGIGIGGRHGVNAIVIAPGTGARTLAVTAEPLKSLTANFLDK